MGVGMRENTNYPLPSSCTHSVLPSVVFANYQKYISSCIFHRFAALLNKAKPLFFRETSDFGECEHDSIE